MNKNENIIIFLKVIFITIFFLLINFSCKNNTCKSDKKSEKHNNNNEVIENKIEHNAILVLKPNGESEYIKKNKDGFNKTKSGLKYKFVEQNFSNKSPKVGDIIIISLKYYNYNDSLIFDSNNVDDYFRMRVTKPSHIGGCIEEAYMMMKKGDSAIFKIDAENFYIYTKKLVHLPEYINKGEKLRFHIRLKDVLTSEGFMQKHSDVYRYQLNKENSLIQRFLLNVDIEPKKFESGLIKITIEQGDGKIIKKGDLVKIDYIASFIDGATFDSTLDRNDHFEFTAGNEEVIKGLDEAVMNMRVGEYAIFIIPFRLAYGDQRQGVVPPFSTLIFEINLIDAS